MPPSEVPAPLIRRDAGRDDATPYGTFTLDARGRITRWNRRLERLTGYSRAQVLGVSFECLFTEEDVAQHWPRRSLAVARRDGRHVDQGPRRHRNGDLFWAEQTLTPLFDDLPDDLPEHAVGNHADDVDAISGYSCALRDVTDRVGTHPGQGMSSALIEQALESVTDAIVTVDERSRITLFNRAAERLFGRERTDVLGSTLDLLTPARLLDGPDRSTPTRIDGLHASGTVLPLEAVRSDSDVNGRRLTTVVFRDLRTLLLAAAADARSRDLEARLTGIAASVPGALFSFRLGPEGAMSFPYLSPGTLQMLGLPPETIEADAQEAFGRVLPEDLPPLLESIDASAREFTRWERDFRYDHPTHGVIWIAGVAAPISDAEGATLWHGFLQDVTRMKSAERTAIERTREAESALSRLHAVMQTMTDGAIVTDREGNIIEVNAPVLRIFDVRDSQILQRDSLAIFAELELSQLDGSVLPLADWPRQRILRGESLRGLELRMFHCPTGRHWIMRFSGGPILGADGELELAVIGIEDVTAQRATEGALAVSEARLQLAVHAGRLGVWDWSPVTRELFLSETAVEMLAAPGPRCTLEDVMHALDPDDVLNVIGFEGLDVPRKSGLPTDFEFRARPGGGEVKWFHVLAHYVLADDGSVTRALGTVGDITRRKRADAELTASEARWRGLADAMPEAVFEMDANGDIVYGNKRARGLEGRHVTDVADLRSALHPDDRDRAVALWQEALATGERLQYEARVQQADGSYRWMRVRSVSERGSDGSIARWYVIASDIDDLKRMHEALGEREQRLQMALRAGGFGVWDWNPQGRTLELFPAAAEILGYAPGVYGAPELLARIHPDDIARGRAEELLAAEPKVPRTSFDIELRAIRGDGQQRWLRVLASYVFDERGRFVRALGTLGDITERRLASEARAANERELRGLAEAVPHAVVVLDGNGRILFRNGLSARLFHPDHGDDMNWAIHPDDRAQVWQLFNPAMAKGLDVIAVECRLRLYGSDEYRWYLGRALPVHDDDERIVRWYATATDIHEHKLTEAALRERETRLRLAMAATRLGVWEWRNDTETFLWSDDCYAILGLQALPRTREELLAQLHPADVQAALGLWSSAVGSRDAQATTLRFLRHGHELRALAVNAHCEFGPDGIAVRMIGTLQDSTDAFVAEHARALQSEVDHALANSTDMAQLTRAALQALCAHTDSDFAALWEFDDDIGALRCIATCNVRGKALQPLDAACMGARSLGDAALQEVRARTQPLAPNVFDLRAEPTRLPCGELATQLQLAGAILLPIVVEGATAGMVALLAPTCTPLAAGLVEQLNFIANQVGQALQRLRVEADIRHFVAGSPVAVYARDLRPGYSGRGWRSDNIGTLLGYDNGAVNMGEWWLERVHPDDREAVRRARFVLGHHDHDVLEYRFRRGDGEYMWLHDDRRVHRDAGGEPLEVIGSLVDVTDRVQLEEDLRQAQKMEAVGRLAGGIAHDFNNLLTVIAGYGELMQQGLQPGDAMRAYVTGIRQASERAADLTRQLLAFSRKQVLEPKVLDLDEVVSDMERLLRRLIGEDIVLGTSQQGPRRHVKVDHGQMQQVLMNLVVNARDAMPQGGTLEISTADVECRADWCRQHPGFTPGHYVRLRVADSGSGMTPDVQARMFEPYYTTKSEGKGTGLGLAMVFGIVSQSGGHILVDSAPGRGTTCDVYLPAIAEPALASGAEHGAGAPTGGRERLLLVEDEPAVRAVARQALEGFGYEVTEAASGEAALELLRRDARGFDLLITDIVMPGMNGHTLADAATENDPRIRVLYISGYSDVERLRYDLQRPHRTFLQKPFTLATLERKVREVIDGSAAE